MSGFEEVVVVLLAGYVAWQLPVWSAKIVPASIGARRLTGWVGMAIQFFVAYTAALIGWIKLNSSIDTALLYLRQIAANPRIIRVVEISDFILALGAFVFVFWLLTLIFNNLPKPDNLMGTFGAIALLALALFWPSLLWGFITKYIDFNLAGAEGLLTTEAWQIIKNGLN